MFFWFKNLKIRNKLLLMSAFVFVIISLTAFAGIYGMAKTQRSAKIMHGFTIQSASYLSAMDVATDNITTALWFIAHAPAHQRKTYKTDIRENEKKLLLTIERYEKHYAAYAPELTDILKKHGKESLIDEETKTLEDIKKVLSIYKELYDEAIKAALLDRADESMGALRMTSALKGTVSEGFGRLMGINRGIAQEMETETNNIFRGTLVLVSALVGLSIVLGAGMSLMLIRAISSPINALSAAAKKIGEGQYLVLAVSTKDELGELAHTFNLMSEKIKAQMEAMSVSLTEMKKAKKSILDSRDAFLNMLEDITESYLELKELFISLVSAMTRTLDAKSKWTKGHSERVAMYAAETAEEMGLDEDETRNIRLAGLLHDIGKIGTSDYLLDKPGRLTDKEFEMVKMHPAQGADILKGIRQMENIIPLIRGHHERIDGRGYPDGLSGDEIPLGARILHVADSFDSMTADRPYRPSPGMEYAVSELKKHSGSQFDAKAVEAFLKLLAVKQRV
ncbi:MAG: HD domain-containing phosphohydrolase [Thermodesulfovibrionales bacterium]|nr:HD domain-containing phosphohydrolase [Thermodesulfovibrionales bacterium]